MKTWIKGGLIGGVILEIVYYLFTYLTKSDIPNVVQLYTFTPIYIFIIAIIGFAIGAIIGYFIEKSRNK